MASDLGLMPPPLVLNKILLFQSRYKWRSLQMSDKTKTFQCIHSTTAKVWGKKVKYTANINTKVGFCTSEWCFRGKRWRCYFGHPTFAPKQSLMPISTEPSRNPSISYAKHIFLQYLCISSFSDFTFFVIHCIYCNNKDSSNKTQFISKGNP